MALHDDGTTRMRCRGAPCLVAATSTSEASLSLRGERHLRASPTPRKRPVETEERGDRRAQRNVAAWPAQCRPCRQGERQGTEEDR